VTTEPLAIEELERLLAKAIDRERWSVAETLSARIDARALQDRGNVLPFMPRASGV